MTRLAVGEHPDGRKIEFENVSDKYSRNLFKTNMHKGRGLNERRQNADKVSGLACFTISKHVSTHSLPEFKFRLVDNQVIHREYVKNNTNLLDILVQRTLILC